MKHEFTTAGIIGGAAVLLLLGALISWFSQMSSAAYQARRHSRMRCPLCQHWTATGEIGSHLHDHKIDRSTNMTGYS